MFTAGVALPSLASEPAHRALQCQSGQTALGTQPVEVLGALWRPCLGPASQGLVPTSAIEVSGTKLVIKYAEVQPLIIWCASSMSVVRDGCQCMCMP